MTVLAMDMLPRVPDAHGDVVDEKIFSDLYIRTSWVDANVALDQIEKVSFFRLFFHRSIRSSLLVFSLQMFRIFLNLKCVQVNCSEESGWF